jgi:hypothetical protein
MRVCVCVCVCVLCVRAAVGPGPGRLGARELGGGGGCWQGLAGTGGLLGLSFDAAWWVFAVAVHLRLPREELLVSVFVKSLGHAHLCRVYSRLLLSCWANML